MPDDDAPEFEPWPSPPKPGDKIVLADGTELDIEFVDAETRKIGDGTIAYEIRVRG